MATPRVTKDITTGVGIISFPKVFPSTKGTKDDGTDDYNCQFIIPKFVPGPDGKPMKNPKVRELLLAVKEVGEAKWGAAYKQVRIPMRDGDKEADQPTDDGTLKRDKYPERLGCYFFNARSQKPVAVIDRAKVPIVNTDDLYSGCNVRVNVTFYPYAQSGNSGIGIALNGVQKVSDGEPIGGGGRPSVDSMFDVLEDEEDDDLDDSAEEEPEPVKVPAKKVAAKKAAPAKKAVPAKKAPVEEVEEDESDLMEEDPEAESTWDDLDD